MRRIFFTIMLAGLLVMAFSGLVLAAEGEAAAGGALGASALKITIAIACGLAIAISSSVGAMAQSKSIVAALHGIARNPGAAGKITTPMIIGLAMIESLVIYTLVISLILVFKV